MLASGISSELSAHQVAPGGVVAHSSPPAGAIAHSKPHLRPRASILSLSFFVCFCWLRATFGVLRIAVLVCLVLQIFRRMTLRVHVFLDFAYRIILKFGNAPDPFRGLREMAMARASLARSSLACLHVVQHVYRMMASAGVIFPAPSGGTPGRTCARVSFEPEWATS